MIGRGEKSEEFNWGRSTLLDIALVAEKYGTGLQIDLNGHARNPGNPFGICMGGEKHARGTSRATVYLERSAPRLNRPG